MSIAPLKSPSATLAPGKRLGCYELVCRIAEGGMGICWLARMGKQPAEKLVAIKTMKAEYATDPDFEQMFLDEARISSKIAHLNVAHIIEYGEHEDVLYIAMEFVDGDSLFKLRREIARKGTAIPVGIAVRILADTLGGLHAAHELTGADGVPLGVVHRDVSPQNILVSTEGIAKLIDFGIAKARDRTAGNTSTGTIKGKIYFMAPEQAIGKAIDRRTDVFATGSILYYLLSGRYAYHGETQAETILKLAEGKPPLPLPRTVSPVIAQAVMKSLSFSPAARYTTAAAMKAALEDALVETGNVTTTAQVAAFVGEHMGHRARARMAAIDAAVAALPPEETVDLMATGARSPAVEAPDAGSIAAAPISTTARRALGAAAVDRPHLPVFVGALERTLPTHISDPARRQTAERSSTSGGPASSSTTCVVIRSAEDAAKAADVGRHLAKALGFSDIDQAKIATAIAELARNILHYAQSGEVRIARVLGDRPGVEIVARDEGPGIADIATVMSEGYKSKTGMGMGLKGTKRLMDSFDIQSKIREGTTVVIRKFA